MPQMEYRMNLVTQVRLARSLKMEEVAQGAHVAENEMCWIERGGVPRLLDAVRLAQFFECNCDELFPGTERHRKTFKDISDGKIPLKRQGALDMPEFDVDPRFWFFCVRLCGKWRRIFVRSEAVQRIRSILDVDRDSFLAVDSCGYHIVFNCQHISAYEIVARKDAAWIEHDPLDELVLSVLFADTPDERKFRFQSPEPLGDVLDPIEFQSPSVESFFEFDDGDRIVGVAPAAVAMMRTSMSNLDE